MVLRHEVAVLAWLVPSGPLGEADAPAFQGRNPLRVSTPRVPIADQPGATDRACAPPSWLRVSGPAITERLNDLCEAVAGRRPMFSDPKRAGLKLAELLGGRPKTLIVVDDVRGASQLRPFLIGLDAQVRMLVTTRDRSLAPLTAVRIVVDAMEPAEPRDVLEAGFPEPVKD
jgi:hypothetical protein